MARRWRTAIGSGSIAIGMALGGPADAQKSGGTLRIYSPDSPASMSSHEEATVFATGPMMGVFNNLVLFDQHAKQNSLESLKPELATSWAWSSDGKALTFQLRQGVRWHDGQPFTAKDVECTWNYVIEKSEQKLRINPRVSFFKNLERIEPRGEHEVTFHLKEPQPAFMMLLGGGSAPVYPCHVSPDVMRRKPVGTGPFKFVDYRPNQFIQVERNRDYWKPDRPYLDGIEWTIMRSAGTAILAFTAGNVDLTFPTVLNIAQMKDLKKQMPTALCAEMPGTNNRNVIINQAVPPFDKLEVRQAIALAIDRKAFIDIIAEGQGEVGAVLQPQPAGLWGLSPELLKELPGYDADVQKNRRQARALMEKLGYGPQNRLKFKLMARDLAFYRDPAVILIDQLKEVHFDAELEVVETAAYFPKLRRKDFAVGLNLQPSGPDPDLVLDAFYGCGSNLNWDGYCNAEIDKLIVAQSREGDATKRRQIHWQIEKRLADEASRPIIFYPKTGTCWHPHVKGFTLQVNSIFNQYRYEDIWLDK
ncbi:MAG: ABC transporter substrate-binding protein [Hyphomicrobiaceae bacterium]